MQISSTSKQPSRPAWTLECLVYEHSILLGMSIDASTHLSYTSALNLYLTFCKLHDFDINPTPETLSLYVTYQSTFINPKSVDSYLSRIANQMEAYFPEVHKNQNSALVRWMLKGTKRWHGVPIHRKNPLSLEDLKVVYNDLKSSSIHDDLLFLSQLLIGFNVLLCPFRAMFSWSPSSAGLLQNLPLIICSMAARFILLLATFSQNWHYVLRQPTHCPAHPSFSWPVPYFHQLLAFSWSLVPPQPWTLAPCQR